MKSLSTSQRIKKALDQLCQRYDVPSGLTSEPKIIEIHNGAQKQPLLKNFTKKWNTLEVFANAHDEKESKMKVSNYRPISILSPFN